MCFKKLQLVIFFLAKNKEVACHLLNLIALTVYVNILCAIINFLVAIRTTE